VLVAETDEKAVELGRNFLWAGGGANFARPEWTLPPGYNSKDATRRLARAQQRTAVLGIGANPEQSGTEAGGARTRLARGEIDMEEARKALYAGYDDACKSFQIVVGSPRTVIEKCRKTLEVLRPGLYSISQASGPLTHDQRQTSIRLFGQEVAPLCARSARAWAWSIPTRSSPARGRCRRRASATRPATPPRWLCDRASPTGSSQRNESPT
jgi:hypothetical protein